MPHCSPGCRDALPYRRRAPKRPALPHRLAAVGARALRAKAATAAVLCGMPRQPTMRSLIGRLAKGLHCDGHSSPARRKEEMNDRAAAARLRSASTTAPPAGWRGEPKCKRSSTKPEQAARKQEEKEGAHRAAALYRNRLKRHDAVKCRLYCRAAMEGLG